MGVLACTAVGPVAETPLSLEAATEFPAKHAFRPGKASELSFARLNRYRGAGHRRQVRVRPVLADKAALFLCHDDRFSKLGQSASTLREQDHQWPCLPCAQIGDSNPGARLSGPDQCLSNDASPVPPHPTLPGLSIPHNSMSQAGESQRDSGSKPRVASRELPWEKAPERGQPQRGCAG